MFPEHVHIEQMYTGNMGSAFLTWTETIVGSAQEEKAHMVFRPRTRLFPRGSHTDYPNLHSAHLSLHVSCRGCMERVQGSMARLTAAISDLGIASMTATPHFDTFRVRWLTQVEGSDQQASTHV